LAKVTAVIDFGSNSVRLAIFKRTSRFGFKIVHESRSRVRIGEGAYQKGGTLQSEPMERAILALKGFKSIIKSFKARKTLAIATSALRDAPNRNQFINRVRKEIDINLKVIDGEKEALFGGIACANLLQPLKGVTVDIGGGSTEFALIDNRRVLKTISINLGTVRLKELFEKDNNIEGAKEYIRERLKEIPLDMREKLLIGIGGTLRAISNYLVTKNRYLLNRVHGYSYKYQDERDSINHLISSPKDKLLKIGIKRERVDVIQWGVLIFREIADLFNVDEVVTSGVGIREGIFLFDILRGVGRRFPENFNPSIRNILDEFQIRDNRVLRHSVRVANALFDTLKSVMNLDDNYRELLIYSAKLADIGAKVDFYKNTKNGFFLILNRFIYGISHQNLVVLAILVRFSNKNSIGKSMLEEFEDLIPDVDALLNLHKIVYLSRILTLDYAYKSQFRFEYRDNRLVINIYNDALHYMIIEKFEKLENFEVEINYICQT